MSSDSETMSNRGPALAQGMWAAMAVAVVIVALRVVAKIKIHHFRVDDMLMVLALALSIASTVFLWLSVQDGFGQDLATLSLHKLELVLRAIAIQVPLITFSTTIARSAFILYLLGILGSNRAYQVALWGSLILQLACNIVSGILPLSICKDVRALWDPTVAAATTCGNTADVIKFSYFSSSINSATDLFLAVFPTVVFWNLNLKLSIKLSLITLMSLGILAMVASIIKTTKLKSVPSVTNLGAGGGVELIRWGYTENVIIIITSSVPCIRPLIMSSVRKFSSAARSRSYELTAPFTGNKATTRNATVQSRTHERYGMGSMSRSTETGSIERILGQDHYLDSEAGITKQVEISVISSGDPSMR